MNHKREHRNGRISNYEPHLNIHRSSPLTRNPGSLSGTKLKENMGELEPTYAKRHIPNEGSLAKVFGKGILQTCVDGGKSEGMIKYIGRSGRILGDGVMAWSVVCMRTGGSSVRLWAGEWEESVRLFYTSNQPGAGLMLTATAIGG